MLQYGVALQKAGRVSSAVQAYRMSAKLNPDDPTSSTQLVLSLHSMHQQGREQLPPEVSWVQGAGSRVQGQGSVV